MHPASSNISRALPPSNLVVGVPLTQQPAEAPPAHSPASLLSDPDAFAGLCLVACVCLDVPHLIIQPKNQIKAFTTKRS